MKLWQQLLGRSQGITRSTPTQEIARYSLNEYANDVSFAFNGSRYILSGGSTGSTKTEDVETSFTGYINAIYKSNGVVFAIILARMLLFTEGRFCWFDVGDNGEDGRAAGRQGLEVLEKPWPNAGTGELLARMEQDVSLGGNFYAVREPNRLRRLRPDWLTIVLTAPPAEAVESDVKGYWYHPGRVYGNVGEPEPTDEIYLPGECLHWSPIPDPDAQYRGMSWLTPVVREVMADKAAMDHKLAFFENGASFGAIISAKENLTNAQFKEWKANFAGVHTGTANAYKPLFLASPVDTSITTADMKQLDFKVTTGAGETRLCAAGGVPPIIVGLSEGLASATYSNYGMARRKFGDHWGRPQWSSASTALSTVVDAPSPDVRLGVNTKGIAFLREDAKDIAEIIQIRAATVSSLISAGFKPGPTIVAVDAEDLTLLEDEHTGLTSVQLLPPGTQDSDGDGTADAGGDAEAEGEYAAALEGFRARFSGTDREILRKFNPSQPRDRRGRWSLSAAMIAALKAQGGEQGGAYFDGGVGGRFFDWSTYDPETGTYQLEISDGEESVVFEVGDYDLEQLFNALTITRLRDGIAGPEGDDDRSVAVATLGALGHADHLVFNRDDDDVSSIDWSTRTENGDYGFGVENGDESVQFDLTPAELAKLIASLALSTQTAESVRAYIRRDRYNIRNPAGSVGGGRFRKLSDVIVALLEDHDGDDDPLEGFSQPQLRKAATQLGVDVAPRMSKPRLKLAILQHLREDGPDDRPDRKAAKALDDAAPTKAPLSAVDREGRPVPVPSKEQRDREILGDVEYERRRGPLPGDSTAEVAAADGLESKIRAAYAAILARRRRPSNPSTGSWVSLAQLRTELGRDLPRAEVDRVLDRMIESPDVHLMAQLNQRALTQADRDAAVSIGGEDRDVIRIDGPPDPLSSLRSLDPEAARDALDLRKIDGPGGLKELLTSAGLPRSGRKRELVDRLVGHLWPPDSERADFGQRERDRRERGAGKATATARGEAVLAAPPSSLARLTEANDPRASSLWYRNGDNSLTTGTGSPGYAGMNEHMRDGESADDPDMDRRIADIDAVMRESRLPSSVEVYRGVDLYFLRDLDDLIGVEFTDRAFVSTTTDRGHGAGFGAVMIIRVPAGTSAIRMADVDGEPSESEILLDRNLRFRVIAERIKRNDRGRIVDHEFDVEVIP